MTARTTTHIRVLTALGNDWLTVDEIRMRTGLGALGVKSTLTAMMAHKEVRRKFGKDGRRIYAVAKMKEIA
jgi:predicted DNA-binding ArsR family transcriptional regulator